MRWIALTLLLITGCDVKRTFVARTEVKKVDGVVVGVSVTFPGHGDSIYIRNRDEMTRLIEATDSLLLDLKSANELMPIVEPPPTPRERRRD